MPMLLVARWVFMCAVIMALAGCAPAPASAPATSAPPAAKPTTAPTVAPTSAPAAAPTTAAPTAPTQATARPQGAVPPQTANYTPTPLNPRQAIRVMDNQVTSMVPIYVAFDRGYFSQEGLDVDMQVLNDNSAIIQTLATNQSQFALTTPDPVIFNAIARGIDIKIVAPSTVNSQTDKPAQFIVRQDLIDTGTVKTESDLRGLNVAVPAQSSQWYVEKTLSLGGLTLKDVNVTVIRTPDVLAAFSSKAIDAAWVPEPVATAINAQGIGKTIRITGELYPGAVAAALTMSPEFAREHPEAAQRFLNAYVRGARDYYFNWMLKQGDSASIVQSFVKHTTIKDPSLYDKIGLPSVDPNVSTDPTPSWNVFQDFFVRQGLQERKIDLSQYVDFTLLNKSLETLGKV
jgi:NitT/TauT family transport system substrate-binding protein